MRSRGLRYGHQPGVEVKWPWELGRLQHLTAIAFNVGDRNAADQARVHRILISHIVDFVSANPPGFGVQWLCPMDAGIRVANLLLAVDLLRAGGGELPDRFLKLVSATARDHGRFLCRNLEWGASLCSNHYLANVAGLLYAGAYLGEDDEASEWVAFAGREIVAQLRGQFHPDGENFEASTCYHRLSAEMVVLSTALMLWLSRERPALAQRWWEGGVRCFHTPPEAPPAVRHELACGLAIPFDVDCQRRIAGMGAFTRSLLRRDGSVPQIGDNDSGRFVRIGCSDDPAADLQDHAQLCSAVDALFGRPSPEAPSLQTWIRSWVGSSALDEQPQAPWVGMIPWTGFGLHVWRIGRWLVTLRCGSVGQNGNGGHAHCDQLSVTVALDGVAIIDDPGTGRYTPDPALRNRMRSSSVHSTVSLEGAEQASWLPGPWGLFAMTDCAHARIVRSGPSGARAEMRLRGLAVSRELEISESEVSIMDAGPGGLMTRFTMAPEVTLEAQSQGEVLLTRAGVSVLLSGSNLQRERVEWSARYGTISRTESVVSRGGKFVLRANCC